MSLPPHERVIYVGIVDHAGQRFVVGVDAEEPATAASVATKRTPKQALLYVYDLVKHHKPIECHIVHGNNKAKMTVIFDGPVRLDTET